MIAAKMMAIGALVLGALGAAPAPVVWNSPSENARGSMPLGNGDVTVNAWVEPSGDLLFYIGKSDAWEDNARLAKVGLVRVKLDGALAGEGFEQRLDVSRGELTVRTARASARLWIDANRPVIVFETSTRAETTATASIELWRKVATTLPSIEMSDVNLDRRGGKMSAIAPTVVEPDTLTPESPSAPETGWYHHNRKSVGPRETMAFQGLLTPDWVDPVLHRTFGAVVRTPPGGKRLDAETLASRPGTSHRFEITVLTAHPSTPDAWLRDVRAIADSAAGIAIEKRYADHLEWWRGFWSRSHVEISAPEGTEAGRAAADVTRGYTLQRFITAAAGRGAFPIKFNGSTFTVPWPGKPGDADYRRWGPGYWWQNTRLPYASLIASGDHDLLQPFFRFYAHDLRKLSLHRTQQYFGFDDAFYHPEVMYFWGPVFADTYGRDVPAADRKDKLQVSGWHKRLWVGGLELSYTLLDYYDHTLDDTFARETLLPTALPIVRFFDRYYPTGADGKLTLEPAQSLETFWKARNPTPELAGLHAVTTRLLALPGHLLPEADRRYLESLRAKLPPLPLRTVDGVTLIAPAETFSDKRNSETPELYAVYPFRLVSFEKPNARAGIESFRRREHKGPEGWRQDELFMAYLGLAEEAKDYITRRATSHDKGCRFPAFWGPNFDWTPDQCHGGVLTAAVQAMLLQTDGQQIFLLPAWPAGWDVRFKLHAPGRTVVECEVRGGKVTSLVVTPESRRKDIVLPAGFRAE